MATCFDYYAGAPPTLLCHRPAPLLGIPPLPGAPPHPSCLWQGALPHSSYPPCPAPSAGLAEALDGRQGEAVDLGSDDFRCALRREPLGVVGLITPW